MLIVRSPLRLSICGGGTDFPYIYSQSGSRFISASIDKYVYVMINQKCTNGISLKYSQLEEVSQISEIRHPIIRETLASFRQEDELDSIELVTVADVPSGTGLGSSGSFGVALQCAIRTFLGLDSSNMTCAYEAFKIEHNVLGESVGVQDQFASAVGGFTLFNVDQSGQVTVTRDYVSREVVRELEQRVVLVSTGSTREASRILKGQEEIFRASTQKSSEYLAELGRVSMDLEKALITGDVDEYGRLMNDHWKMKRRRHAGVSNAFIDSIYERGIRAGAIGGKLVGAGGGGYVMFVCKSTESVKKSFSDVDLRELTFNFSDNGTTVIGNYL